jgi:hypothetical protein
MGASLSLRFDPHGKPLLGPVVSGKRDSIVVKIGRERKGPKRMARRRGHGDEPNVVLTARSLLFAL